MPAVTKGRKRQRRRIDWTTLLVTTIAGAAILGGLFWVLSLAGCAAGFTEPDALGNRKVLLGIPAGTLADAGTQFGQLLGDNLGLLLGLGTGGTGLLGVAAVKLVRAWSDQKATAHAAVAARTAADTAFDEGAARAGGPTIATVAAVPVAPGPV